MNSKGSMKGAEKINEEDAARGAAVEQGFRSARPEGGKRDEATLAETKKRSVFP